MSNSLDWRKYVTDEGDFELPTYIYKLIMGLMKQSLDMGTLLSNDPAKTRAYKEQIKRTFKDQWRNIAEALEFFEIIVACTCNKEFCDICGGSRYVLNSSLSPDVLREISVVTAPSDDPALQRKLEAGLERALKETASLDLS